jgi:hypothetical protein
MKRIANLIQANLNLRFFLPLLALALLTTWYGLFYSVEKLAAMTGGLSFMDMQPMLTVEQLFEQISTYSPETISFYVGWSLFDYAWPLVTFTTVCFISAWLLSFLSEKWQQKFWLLVTAAYTTVIFDWLENMGFVALVLGVPAEPVWLAQLTLTLHAGKLLFNMLFNVGTWVLLIAVIVTAIRSRFSR